MEYPLWNVVVSFAFLKSQVKLLLNLHNTFIIFYFIFSNVYIMMRFTYDVSVLSSKEELPPWNAQHIVQLLNYIVSFASFVSANNNWFAVTMLGLVARPTGYRIATNRESPCAHSYSHTSRQKVHRHKGSNVAKLPDRTPGVSGESDCDIQTLRDSDQRAISLTILTACSTQLQHFVS